jgi:hypothetical protein
MDHVRGRTTGDTSAFFHTIAGFAIAVLAAFGVGGTFYHLIAPGGWLAQVFDRSVAGGLAVLLALYIVGLCAWLTAREVVRRT